MKAHVQVIEIASSVGRVLALVMEVCSPNNLLVSPSLVLHSSVYPNRPIQLYERPGAV